MADAVAFPKLIFKGRGSSVLGTGSSAQLIMCGPRVCGQEFPFLRHILAGGARGVRWDCQAGTARVLRWCTQQTGLVQNRQPQKIHGCGGGFLKGQNLAQSVSLRLWCLQQSLGCVLTTG